MADLVTDLLSSLAAAAGDAQMQAALVAEFAVSSRPESEGAPLLAALETAAVLHWFDPSLLVAVGNVASEAAPSLFETLKSMAFVERYRRGEADLRNVHESTRLGLRRRLASRQADRFRQLSLRAAAAFSSETLATSRIEWIYHRLSGDPEKGATELEELHRDWSGSARPEDFQTLAARLEELEQSRLLTGRAQLWARLVVAWARTYRGDYTASDGLARDLLTTATQLHDDPAAALSWVLLGDVQEMREDWDGAERSFSSASEILERLAERQPGHSGRQRDLAVVQTRLGGVMEKRGDSASALVAFQSAASVLQKLHQQNPENSSWLRDLAVCHGRVGWAYKTLGRAEEAKVELDEDLRLSQLLARRDPENADWQQDLASSYRRAASLVEGTEKAVEAQGSLREAMMIGERLVQRDPRNAAWQRDFADATSAYARSLNQSGAAKEAYPIFQRNVEINRALAELDPRSISAKRELGYALWWCGSIAGNLEMREPARTYYEEAERWIGELAAAAPTDEALQKALESVRAGVAKWSGIPEAAENTSAMQSGSDSSAAMLGG